MKKDTIIDCNKIRQSKYDNTIDITKEYNFEKNLKNEISKALVYLISDKKNKYIFKFYLDDENRAIRELISLCYLSGTDGFSTVYDIGYCLNPIKWSGTDIEYKKDGGYFVIMSIIDGEVLNMADIKIGKTGALNISLGILYRLIQMRNIIGENFEHYDLHPNNIIIDNKKCENNNVKILNKNYIIDCPKIYIIDYDLSTGGKLKDIPDTYIHKRKMNDRLDMMRAIVPKTTVLFLIKWEKDIIKALKEVYKIVDIDSKDIRNWILISGLIFRINGIEDNIEMCKNAEECMNKNMRIFESLEI